MDSILRSPYFRAFQFGDDPNVMVVVSNMLYFREANMFQLSGRHHLDKNADGGRNDSGLFNPCRKSTGFFT